AHRASPAPATRIRARASPDDTPRGSAPCSSPPDTLCALERPRASAQLLKRNSTAFRNQVTSGVQPSTSPWLVDFRLMLHGVHRTLIAHLVALQSDLPALPATLPRSRPDSRRVRFGRAPAGRCLHFSIPRS